jgi:hypothetical protein
MNRTLQYLKNIRFNPIINKTAAQQSKQKYAVNKSKQRISQGIKHVIIRKYTTSSNNKFPLPPDPNDPFWILIIMASTGGILNILKDIYYEKK